MIACFHWGSYYCVIAFISELNGERVGHRRRSTSWSSLRQRGSTDDLETNRFTIEGLVVSENADDRRGEANAHIRRNSEAVSCLELASDRANNLLLNNDWIF